MPIIFERDFTPNHGKTIPLNDKIARVTANNASAFTFTGTNSYLVGQKELMIIDPGPDDDAHFHALLAAVGTRSVSHILVTHTHRDHSALAPRLARHFSSLLVAEGKHHTARNRLDGEITALDASADHDFTPDVTINDGAILDNGEVQLTAIFTPGHTANHMAFAFDDLGILFSGDHVMAWATTVIVPPDGSMKDYMASLDKLLQRKDRVYLTGHGGPVMKPAPFVRGLKAHRKMRERAILERIAKGDHRINEMVDAIYRRLDPRLRDAAALSVFAHLEDLHARGLILTDGSPKLDGFYSSV